MGPAVGGALLLAFGANLGILINAALYLPFIIWLASAPYGPKFRTVGTVVAQRAVRGFGDIVHALREIAQHRVIAAMTVLAGAASLCIGNAYQAQWPAERKRAGSGKRWS